MGKRRKPVLCLTFLLYPCEEAPRRWVAHCLELDVVAVGSNRPRAITLLKELITELFTAAAQDDTLDKVFNPAPTKYWQMLEHAEPYVPPRRVRDLHIDAQPVKSVDYAMARA